MRTWSLSAAAGFAVAMAGAAAHADTAAQTGASDEVRALVAEMLADAQGRSSLLQGGGSAGHDGKFFLASADGNFRLNVNGQVQLRTNISMRDDGSELDADGDGVGDFEEDNDADGAADNGIDDFQTGFENRRTKLIFSGHVWSPDTFYKLQGNFASDGGGFELEDAFMGWDMGEGSKIIIGQFKVPLNREEMVASSSQLAADRSLTNEFFNADRTQGVAYKYEADSWKFTGGFTDGFRQANTESVSDANDYAFTARFEWMWAGAWDQFDDFTSPRGSAYGGMLGVAGHYQHGEDIGDIDGDDFYAYTFDASMEGDGWNAFAAFIAASTEPEVGDGTDNFGYVVQGGYYLNDTWELFGRWDHLLLDDEAGLTNDEIKTFTVGVNYYMHGHASKFTLDLNWCLDESFATAFDDDGAATEMFSATGIGYQGDDDADEVYIRAQWQVLF